MKKHTIAQYVLLFTICIALNLTGGVPMAAAEDDWIPCAIKFYYSPDEAVTNMLESVTLKDETTGESYEEPTFHAYDNHNAFYVYLDKGSADSMELLTAENEPSGDDTWWGEAKALGIQPWETENPIMKSIDEQNEFVAVEPVDNKDGWYKITVQDAVKDNLGLNLEIRTVGTSHYTDEEGQDQSDSWVDGRAVTILYHEAPLTLVNENDPFDFNTYLDGNPRTPVEFQIQQLTATNGKVTFDKITSPDALDLLVSTREDDWEDGQEHIEKADPATYTLTVTDGIFSFTSENEGRYYLVPKGSYTVEDTNPTVPTALPDNPLQIEVWLPNFSFHARPEKTVDTWLGSETTYKEPQTSTMYVMPYFDENDPWATDPTSIEFAAYNSDNEKLPDYITAEADTENPNIYRITITDKASGDFTINATAKYNGYGDTENPDLSELLATNFTVKSTLKDIRIKTPPAKTTYTEGEAFDKTGIVVEAVYNDHSAYAVTDYTITAPAKFATTDKEVSISWHGKIAKQAVAVNAKATQPPVTAKLKVGDTIVSGGYTYQVTMATSDKKEVAYKGGNKKVKKVTIPSSVTINGTAYNVTEIAANSFSGNKKLTGITIPATVIKIGNNAFKNCTKLTKITVPKNVTSIGKNAFSGCKQIKNIIIKSTKLKTIGKSAFSGCKQIKSITIKSTKLKTIGKNAFKGVSKKTTIKVPKSRKKVYTTLLKKAGFKGKVK